MENNPDKMIKTYEKTIDKNIDVIKRIQSNGLSEEQDMEFLDICLKFVILDSERRNQEDS